MQKFFSHESYQMVICFFHLAVFAVVPKQLDLLNVPQLLIFLTALRRLFSCKKL